jgi:hypothetical protein
LCLDTDGSQVKEHTMQLRLISEFNESTQYRTKSSFRQTDARIIANHVFMDMIALWILYNEYAYAPVARDYAANTVTFNRFSNFRQMGTDLYLGLHVISERRIDLLVTEADITLIDRLNPDIPGIVKYLRSMSNNTLSPAMVRITLQRLEASLQIEDPIYRSIRRLAQSWPTLSNSQRRLVITRMSFFYRTHARRSEVFQMIDGLAKTNGLYDRSAVNPEVPGKIKTAAAATAAAAAGFAVGYQLGKGFV